MISKMKKLMSVCLVAFMAVALVSCGGSEGSGGTSEVKSKVYIEDIAWKVDTSIVDGERCVMFEYTNNSKYTITGLKISFVEKEDVTEEQLNAFYEYMIKKFELSDEEQTELKENGVGMNTESERIVKSGETASNIELNYYDGYYGVENIDHYDLVEPDIATYSYIDENKIYTVNYDFKADKYTMEQNIETAVYWPSSEVGTMIPQPEAEVIKDDMDGGEEGFYLKAFGVSREMLDDYTAQCKEKGFTIDPIYYDGYYTAANAEGYELAIMYDEDDLSMEISLMAPHGEDDSEE